MSLTLYQIADQYRMILRELDQPDIGVEDQDALKLLVQNTLNNLDLDTAFEEKALAVGMFCKELASEAEAVKKTEESLRSRRKSLELRYEWLRDYLLVQMQKVKKAEVKNDQIVLKLRKTPGRLVIDRESDIPPEYIETQTITSVRKNWMLEKLKSGELDSIPGVHVETGFSLSLR
jgi:hypothetical protein